MEKTLQFIEYTSENLQKIGEGHQVIGISEKNNKYVIGNTRINKNTGNVVCTLYLSYYTHIAVLD